MTSIDNGWTRRGTTPYFFEHIESPKANKAKDRSNEDLHVVETINGSFGNGDPRFQHRNRYFCWGMHGAIALASMITIESLEVAEMVVAVRLATVEEWDGYADIDHTPDAEPATECRLA